ncbi:MAG: hypothetical protein WCV67_21615 [Victivallaceae bacterium]|jgi:hypothetical protein
MNGDMEKYLSRFKLPEPSAGLRLRVLDSAQAHRQQQPEISIEFVFGVKIFLSAAAIILVSITLLNLLSFSRPVPDMKKYEAAIEQVTQFGVSREHAASMIAVWEATRKTDINKRSSIKGDLS